MRNIKKLLHYHFNDPAYIIYDFLFTKCQRLCNACESENYEEVKKIIRNIENEEIKIYYLNHGLYDACKCGNIEIVELLIEHGANDWEYGLMGYYEGCGDLNIIDLMMGNIERRYRRSGKSYYSLLILHLMINSCKK